MSGRRHQDANARTREHIEASSFRRASRGQTCPRSETRRVAAVDRPAARLQRRCGFSLIELLLAVFILGIGVIAVAALFPAGIAQQRQSVDDTIGPIVANNALAVLRSKLRAEDFGFFLDAAGYPDFDPVLPTVRGDWTWRRPGFYTTGTSVPGSGRVPAGSISIFRTTTAQVQSEGIPWNTFPPTGATAPPDPPIIITQGERYYPMATVDALINPNVPKPRPQYVWDCMFRRFQGKILVAIFVYRVNIPGGGSVTYAVPPNYSNTTIPPLPISLDLAAAGRSWDADADLATPGIQPFVIIPGTDAVSDPNYNPSDHAQAWQAPAQWLLDQNNNVHRVLSGRRNASDGPVELVRPIPSMAVLPVYFLPAGSALDDVVTNIWYIPVEVELDTDGDGTGDLPVTLRPVYVTVREL